MTLPACLLLKMGPIFGMLESPSATPRSTVQTLRNRFLLRIRFHPLLGPKTAVESVQGELEGLIFFSICRSILQLSNEKKINFSSSPQSEVIAVFIRSSSEKSQLLEPRSSAKQVGQHLGLAGRFYLGEGLSFRLSPIGIGGLHAKNFNLLAVETATPCPSSSGG